jgi:hypothetical protein
MNYTEQRTSTSTVVGQSPLSIVRINEELLEGAVAPV